MSTRSVAKKVFDFSLLRRVLKFASPYKRRFFISLTLAILLALFSPIRPYLVQLTVNDYIKGGVSGSGAVKMRMEQLLIWITVIQVVLLLVESALRFYFSFLTAWLGQTVVKDLRVLVYEKILGLNLSQFDKTPIGTLTTRTINDIEAINDIFAEGLLPIIADLLSIVCILFYMFYVDWQLTLICLAPFPLLIIATWFFKESVNKSFIRVRNAVANLNAFVQEHITGMQVIQAFSAEEKEFGKFRNINKEHRNANINAIFAYSVFFPIVEIVLAVGTAMMVWWGAVHALDIPREQASDLPGKMVAFYFCLNFLFRPLRVIADKFNVLQMGMVASDRVFKVLENDDYIKTQGIHVPTAVKGKIEFENVWFAYTDDRYVLKNISFRAEPGETVAIVGHTGSGKTSIISLMNRLYHIQKGSIRIDDIPVEEFQARGVKERYRGGTAGCIPFLWFGNG